MKKISVIVISMICIVICIFVGIIVFSEKKFSEKSKEYLIDIIIENKDRIDIDYLQMGIILSDDNEEIINTVQGSLANNDMIHFTINYSPDTLFFLKGMSGKKEIETCFFDVKEYSKVNELQEIYFYIEDFKIYKE